eukprot:SM000076S21770  [mRNA]  locus=s76:161980:165413:- [translate_table: standard]
MSEPTPIPGKVEECLAAPGAGKDDALSAVGKFNSAAAFVESGVQDGLEDACSICLETFTVDEPSTLTTCNHEYHLQCILEWAQRSQECPMCWQPLSLRDADSQELLEACSQERALLKQALSPPVFYRAPLDGFEMLRYAASYPDDTDLERRIMQHLAAAAAGMSRARLANQDTDSASTPSAVTHAANFGRATSAPNAAAGPSTSTGRSGGLSAAGISKATSSSSPISPLSGSSRTASAPGVLLTGNGAGPAVIVGSAPLVGSGRLLREHARKDIKDRHRSISSDCGESSQRDTPSGSDVRDYQGSEISSSSSAESLKGRFVAASTRYRETLSKSTRSFRERLRLRSTAVADLSARAREMSAGVMRAFERPPVEATDLALRAGADAERPPTAAVDGDEPSGTPEPSLTTAIVPGENANDVESDEGISSLSSHKARIIAASGDGSVAGAVRASQQKANTEGDEQHSPSIPLSA